MQRKSLMRAGAVVFATLVLLVLSTSVTLFAQLTTGKVEGTVRDKDTGQPLAGAQVTVEGTRLGNVTNTDGYYFILNVPPGLQSVTFTYTGYQKTTVANVMILAGQTITVDGALSSTVIQIEGITIEGESEVLRPRDETTTKRRVTAEQLAESPVTKLDDLLVLSAGVQSGGGGGMSRGLRIRGGRLGEEGMVVDGIMVRNYTANPFTGGSWIIGHETAAQSEDTTPLEFSTESIEQVDIITGGFQAEYGNAQSGIINIVTREGGPQLKGSVRFITDEINPRTADYGYNQLQARLGGPLGIPNLYFMLTGEIQGMADRIPTHADEGFRGVNQTFVDRLNESVRNDPDIGGKNVFTLEKFKTGQAAYGLNTGGNQALFEPGNPVRLPHNWEDGTRLSGKLTFAPTEGLKFIASHNFSRPQNSYPSGQQNGEGNYFKNGIFYKGDPLWDLREWGPDTVVNIHQAYGRRTFASNFLGGFNWDFYKSSARSASVQFRYSDFRTRDNNTSSLLTNWERETFMGWSMHDIRFQVENWPDRSGVQYDKELSKKYLPDGESGWKKYVPYYTPFEQELHTAYYEYYRYQREFQKNYKVDFDVQLNRTNRAKIGVQYTTVSNFSFRTTYTTEERNAMNEFRYDPVMYSVYAQNRTDLGDFVFDYGLRYDGFTPRGNWFTTNLDQSGERVQPKTKYTYSPRLNVAFPVTDKAQLRFSYGAFTQLPSLAYIFSRPNCGVCESNNPGDLEYSRTDAFEGGVSYIVSQDVLFELVAYYRDVTGNVASGKEYFLDYYRYFTQERKRIWHGAGYSNRDDGNIKGLDLVLKKRFSDNYSLDLQYTLQFSRTTGSSPGGGTNLIDAATNERYTPPDELTPISQDRTHQMSARFNYMFPEDFKIGTTAGTILKNVRAHAAFSLMSGTPYSSSRGGYQIGGLNFFRGRWYTNLDLRFTKSFNMGASRRVSVFTEIFNALNRKTNQSYPTYSYYGNLVSARQAVGKDLKWADMSAGNPQRYRFAADFNGDGTLTLDEAALGIIANRMLLATMDKRDWGLARQIRTGVSFSF